MRGLRGCDWLGRGAELAKLDQERDIVRARMEDSDLEYATSSPAAAAEMMTTQEAAKERWIKRQSRRAWEQKKGSAVIPPGPWSQDLDDYHDENGYVFDLGDGYSGKLVRNDYASFNGYVTVPVGHPCVGLEYYYLNPESWDEVVLPSNLPTPPIQLTFSMGDRNVFGFDHNGGSDITPIPRGYPAYEEYNHYSRDLYRPLTEGRIYVDFGSAVTELKTLAAYFKTLERDYWPEILLWRSTIGVPVGWQRFGPPDVGPTLERRRQVIVAKRSPAVAAWIAARKERLGL